MKKQIALITIFILFLLMFIVLIVNIKSSDNKNLYNGLPVQYVHTTYVYDTSTMEKAIGVSDYVFVAKINEIIETRYLNPIEVQNDETGEKIIMLDPYTVYSINIIKNIKGNLITTEPIEFIQYGGLNKDGKGYTFLEGSGLLNVGSEYILMPDAITENGDIEVADPNRIILLDNSSNVRKMDASYIINDCIEAYSNQIIPSEKENKKSKYDIQYYQSN